MESRTRRDRLEQLLNLAQTYRGWTRKQLAKSLGRETTKLVPNSGLPKLDLLMDLSRVLDWPVEDVAKHVWGVPWKEGSVAPDEDFGSLEAASRVAHCEGQYQEAINLAQHALSKAQSSEERAIASNREASGWDGLGRYAKVMEVAQRGLQERGVSADRRLTLQANLATAYYAQWHLVEATAMAQTMVMRYEAEPPTNRLNRVVQAFAYYIRGNSYRRSASIEQQDAERYARLAKHDLQAARQYYLELADEFNEESYRGIANTCQGGLIEMDAVLGRRTVAEALGEFEHALDGLVDPTDYPVGDKLESYGWWCIFGCNVALRHLDDQREVQRLMALFTNKADEIARRLNNWSIRERVFAMDYARRQRFADWTGVETEWTIDKEDLRVITGTMGRFPAFQPIGWRILDTAKIVGTN